LPSFLIVYLALIQLMKQSQTIALTAVLAVAVGMVGFNGAFGDTFGFYSSPEIATSDVQTYKGHIILKHFDAEGNLLAYQQTDNVITFTGKNCAANLVFGTTFGSCTTPLVFDKIALSIDTGAGFTDAATVLAGECTTGTCGAGLDARLVGPVTADQAATTGNPAIVQIQRTFTSASGIGPTIASAGLFDALTTGNLFALKAFTPTVVVNNGDSIQITWLITLT